LEKTGGEAGETTRLMIGEIPLLFDEDVHLGVAHAVRSRGVDAVHISELGRTGLSDEDQLEYAVQQQRCLVTFNVGDFVMLHSTYINEQRQHFGLIVSAQIPIGIALRRLLLFMQTHGRNDVRSQLFFL
jgi:hypothetical protein